jgi:beta-glucosidase
LAPGEDRRVAVSIDPRLLATFDETARRWRIARGEYRITAGFDAERRELSASFALDSAKLPP